MSVVATRWLPDSAFTPAAIDAALADLLRDWSIRWFEGQISVDAVTLGSTGHRLPQVTQIGASGRTCSTTALGRVKRALLEKLLGLSLQGCTLGEADHRLLDALGREAMDDLLSQIDLWADKQRADGGVHDQVAVSLCADGMEIMQLLIARETLASALKSAVKPVVTLASDLTKRTSALGDTDVRVEAVLGSGKISFADLSQLAVGDVLLLDQATEEAAELRLTGTGVSLARGELGRDEHHVTITLN